VVRWAHPSRAAECLGSALSCKSFWQGLIRTDVREDLAENMGKILGEKHFTEPHKACHRLVLSQVVVLLQEHVEGLLALGST